VPGDVGLEHAIEMGQETFDHLDGYIAYLDGESEPLSDEAIAAAVQMTIDAGAWVVPTMVVWETAQGVTDLDWAMNLSELKYMPQHIVDGWIQSHRNRISNPQFNREAAENHIANRMRLLAALNDAGARILMGTDAPQWFSVPGFSIHLEVNRMVEAGMTPYEVYHTGTVRVGEYFADKDEFGTIAEGERADLLLVEANPLDDVANIQQRAGVMVAGRWIPEETIQRRLEEIASMYGTGN
jgi:imidazolonepropionase-like amidohydrolase